MLHPKMSAIAAAALALAVLFASCSQGREEGSGLAAGQHPTSQSCAACHADQFETWSGSHHDLAMQHANGDTVLGDFTAQPLTWFRGTEVHQTSFRREGDAFIMRTEGGIESAVEAEQPGADRDFQIAFVFGVEPLQQYLVEFPDGALQCLPVAWDTLQSKWFHLDPEAVVGDALHWTGRMQRWNMMCAECHSTNLQKGYDAATDEYNTTYEELNVGCRACHGDGAEHMRLAGTWTPETTPQASSDLGFGPLGDPAHFELETCAHCHSRRSSLTGSWEPGEKFLDHFDPALLREGLYFPDGQIQDEVYVWGSFSQSRMHAAGVTCADCHDPHSLELKIPEGPGQNGLCLQCHSTAPPTERFPTITAKDYNSQSHHQHEPGSEASRCTTCHMPNRTYMGVDERRDHRMGVPRPDLSAELGVPNACSTCHAEELDGTRDAEWAAEQIASWRAKLSSLEQQAAQGNYENRDQDTFLARTFSNARSLFLASPSERAANFSDLLKIAKDTNFSALQRATAIELITDFGPAALASIKPFIHDPAPLLRVAAARAMRRYPQPEGFEFLLYAPRLDPIAAVRVAAANAADLGRYRAINADFPSSHFDQGMWEQAQGDFASAEKSWKETLILDPDFLPAVHNLAILLNAQGRGPEAAATLDLAFARHPNEGELAYSLGLQLAELGKKEGALAALISAAKLLPARPRFAYNLSLAHSAVGDVAAAELELRRAISLNGSNEQAAADAQYALAILLVQTERNAEALGIAKHLRGLGFPGAEELIAELGRRAGTGGE